MSACTVTEDHGFSHTPWCIADCEYRAVGPPLHFPPIGYIPMVHALDFRFQARIVRENHLLYRHDCKDSGSASDRWVIPPPVGTSEEGAIRAQDVASVKTKDVHTVISSDIGGDDRNAIFNHRLLFVQHWINIDVHRIGTVLHPPKVRRVLSGVEATATQACRPSLRNAGTHNVRHTCC